jgi:hypothetical protein
MRVAPNSNSLFCAGASALMACSTNPARRRQEATAPAQKGSQSEYRLLSCKPVAAEPILNPLFSREPKRLRYTLFVSPSNLPPPAAADLP